MKLVLLQTLLLTAFASQSFDQLLAESQSFSRWQIGVRRWLHQHPELAYQEFETTLKIQQELKELGIKFTSGWGKRTLENGTIVGGTGVVADIGSGASPCVGLRSDIDALPIEEKADIPYMSLSPGRMHACGHDAHMAMLLGAARLLKAHESSLNGTVRLFFQPAEEGGAGAEAMVNEGLLTLKPPVQAAFGLHVNPFGQTNIISGSAGPTFASATQFNIRVDGVGGHASNPVYTRDPVTTAAAIIQNLNTLVARQVSVIEQQKSGVVSITAIHSPQSYNVIPPWATMKGTIRSLDDSMMKQLKEKVIRVVESTASMFGLNATITFEPNPYPVVVNDKDLYDWASKIHTIEAGAPVMAGEDFAFYAQKVPSIFLRLGIGSGSNPPTNINVHNDHFVIDEKALPYGSSFMAHMAIQRIQALQSTPQGRSDEL